MIRYTAVHFDVQEPLSKEVLSYKLSELRVESIEEKEDELIAYFQSNEWLKVEDELSEYLQKMDIEYFFAEVENQNWNAQWEASFQPVNINNFCYVRAPFHDPSRIEGIIDLILEPKMAFGTAHHETTFMMMAQMEKLDFNGKSVFDYGCGTAILSVLAEKLGAKKIHAIDIEENALENAIYNAEINNCQNITCEQKTLPEIEVHAYDIILANINRQVLLDSAGQLSAFLKQGGVLLISGILIDDEGLVVKTYEDAGFRYLDAQQKGEWKCMKFSGR